MEWGPNLSPNQIHYLSKLSKAKKSRKLYKKISIENVIGCKFGSQTLFFTNHLLFQHFNEFQGLLFYFTKTLHVSLRDYRHKMVDSGESVKHGKIFHHLIVSDFMSDIEPGPSRQ